MGRVDVMIYPRALRVLVYCLYGALIGRQVCHLQTRVADWLTHSTLTSTGLALQPPSPRTHKKGRVYAESS